MLIITRFHGSRRWNVGMPSLVKYSIKIISDAGLGMAMFSLGILLSPNHHNYIFIYICICVWYTCTLPHEKCTCKTYIFINHKCTHACIVNVAVRHLLCINIVALITCMDVHVRPTMAVSKLTCVLPEKYVNRTFDEDRLINIAGLFMALQPRIIACGTKRATVGMVIRFLCGPIIMSAASLAVGLRGEQLHAAIVQVLSIIDPVHN